MFLTKEILEEKQACGAAYRWFLKKYPNGVELSEIISSRHISVHVLHWGYDNLDYNEEEEKLYFEALKVLNSSFIYKSDHVENSQYIQFSSKVKNSSEVYHSVDISGSNKILKSNDVDNSELIFNSDFVFDSSFVFKSNNVNNSLNVVESTYVINSQNVFKSNNITDCNSIYNCQEVEDSYLCSDCLNAKHCFACQGLKEVEYYAFNQQVTPKQFETIVKQFTKLMTDIKLHYVEEWPDRIDKNYMPKVIPVFPKHYETLPEKIFKWLKTLPKYNKQVLFAITLNSSI